MRIIQLFFPLALLLAVTLINKQRLCAESFGGHLHHDAGRHCRQQERLRSRTDVYLNGGPQNTKSSGLSDGTYYFQVTDPGGRAPPTSRQTTPYAANSRWWAEGWFRRCGLLSPS